MTTKSVRQRVAIVGAGPAGTSLGTFCARKGHDVTIFEARQTPAAVVGESLLPYGNRVLSLLGVSMDGFVVKKGALFVHKGKRLRYGFDEAERCIWPAAHQVPRVKFDLRLRQIAQEAGVRFEYREVKEPPLGYDWVVDATGRRRVLGRKWTAYSGHKFLRNAAVMGHVRARLQPKDSEPGDITIYSIEDGWLWCIPLSDELTSVGLVTTPQRRGLKWEDAMIECEDLGQLVKAAPPIETFQGYQDFTEYAETFCGPGWAVVGDAALFLDPVFSSGVLFSLEGGERLSRVIDGEISPEQYEASLRKAASRVETLIVGFYSGDFFDLGFLKGSSQAQPFRAGVVSLLSGDVFDESPRMANVVARRLPDVARMAREAVE